MKNKSVLSTILFFSILNFPFHSISAQIQVQSGISHAYDDNPFRLVEPEANWISTLDLGLQYDFSKVSLSYEGSFTRFDRLMERNFYWHQISVFGTGEKINWSLSLDESFNGTDYDIYNQTAAGVSVDYQFKFRLFTLSGSGSFIYNYYPQLKDINNYFAHTDLQIRKSLPTRTTIIGGVGISYKYYPYSVTTETPQLSLYPVLSIKDGGYGGGFGGGTGGSSGSYQIYTSAETPYAAQMQLWIRLAQSVFSKTGVAVQYLRWISLSGYNRSITGVIYDYNDESAIFDDPLGYELQSLHAEFTQLLPFQAILKIGYDFGDKNYTTQGIYTSELAYSDSVFRVDNNKYLSISLQKYFMVGKMLLNVELLYQWLYNNSNSYWYNYKSGNMAVLLNWHF